MTRFWLWWDGAGGVVTGGGRRRARRAARYQSPIPTLRLPAPVSAQAALSACAATVAARGLVLNPVLAQAALGAPIELLAAIGGALNPRRGSLLGRGAAPAVQAHGNVDNSLPEQWRRDDADLLELLAVLDGEEETEAGRDLARV